MSDYPDIDTSNLSVGMRFKNFPTLLEAVGLPRGAKRESVKRHLWRFLEWEKTPGKQEVVITLIREVPIGKAPNPAATFDTNILVACSHAFSDEEWHLLNTQELLATFGMMRWDYVALKRGKYPYLIGTEDLATEGQERFVRNEFEAAVAEELWAKKAYAACKRLASKGLIKFKRVLVISGYNDEESKSFYRLANTEDCTSYLAAKAALMEERGKTRLSPMGAIPFYKELGRRLRKDFGWNRAYPLWAIRYDRDSAGAIVEDTGMTYQQSIRESMEESARLLRSRLLHNVEKALEEERAALDRVDDPEVRELIEYFYPNGDYLRYGTKKERLEVRGRIIENLVLRTDDELESDCRCDDATMHDGQWGGLWEGVALAADLDAQS